MPGPISVDEFLKEESGEEQPVKKASPTPSDGAPKALVITGSTPEENNVSEWMADEAVEAMKHHGEVEIARYALPKLRIHPCVGCYGGGGRMCMHPCDRNDIESDIYRPDDQMSTLYDQMLAADMLLLATDVRWSGLNHFVQRFTERLNPFVNQAAAGKPVLKKKVAGLIVVGDGSVAAAGLLMSTLNAVGYAFPRYAYAAWHIPRGVSAEQTKSAYEKSRAVHEDLRLLAEDLMDYSKSLRGE